MSVLVHLSVNFLHWLVVQAVNSECPEAAVLVTGMREVKCFIGFCNGSDFYY